MSFQTVCEVHWSDLEDVPGIGALGWWVGGSVRPPTQSISIW